ADPRGADGGGPPNVLDPTPPSRRRGRCPAHLGDRAEQQRDRGTAAVAAPVRRPGAGRRLPGRGGGRVVPVAGAAAVGAVPGRLGRYGAFGLRRALSGLRPAGAVRAVGRNAGPTPAPAGPGAPRPLPGGPRAGRDVGGAGTAAGGGARA